MSISRNSIYLTQPLDIGNVNIDYKNIYSTTSTGLKISSAVKHYEINLAY